MGKRALVCVLALCLLAANALALPEEYAGGSREESEAVQETLSLVLGAAVLRGQDKLLADEAPSQPLYEGILLLYADRLGADEMTDAELAPVCGKYLSNAAYEKYAQSECPCMELTETGIRFKRDMLLAVPRTGVIAFAADGKLECELYSYYDADAGDREWLCHASVTLDADGRVVSYCLSPFYADGDPRLWNDVKNAEAGFSCRMPGIFAQQTAEEGAAVYTAAGARLTVGSARGTERFIRFGETDAAGFVPGADGVNGLEMRMEFSAERADEYRLYAEMIFDSLEALH